MIFGMRVLSALVLLVAAFAQTQKERDFTRINTAKLFENAPGPVKLTAKEFAVTLCNTARVQLTQYRIGCIEKKEDKFQIVHKDELVDDQIEGNGGSLTIERTHTVFPFDECTKGKLAVIEVTFADGTRWELQP